MIESTCKTLVVHCICHIVRADFVQELYSATQLLDRNVYPRATVDLELLG